MVKRQNTEAKSEESVLKYMTKPEANCNVADGP